MKALGRQVLVEFYDCDPALLNNPVFVEGSMKEAAVVAGSSIVDSVFRIFAPHGVSGVVVIAESHLAIHTWPEYGYAAVDLFTCGDKVDPWAAHDYLRDALRAGNSEYKELPRGKLQVLGEDARHKPTDRSGPLPQQVGQ